MYCLNFSETILAFWYYRGYTVSRNSHEVKRLVIAILLKAKAWYLQNQINEKDQDTLIEQSTHELL